MGYVCVCVYVVGFICKQLKEYKLVSLIIGVDQNNQGMIWIHMKYGKQSLYSFGGIIREHP